MNVRGYLRRNARGGFEQGVAAVKHRRSSAVLACALAVGAADVAPPLERLADRFFTWHMLQHLVPLYLITLIVLLARPFEIVASVAGKAATASFVRAMRPLHVLAQPPVALAIFVGTLWMSPFPGLYEASLDNPGIHAAEHALVLHRKGGVKQKRPPLDQIID
ncbi:MAG: cytochrome c oxidase assembly protein [Candidatus Cybelea sp.]